MKFFVFLFVFGSATLPPNDEFTNIGSRKRGVRGVRALGTNEPVSVSSESPVLGEENPVRKSARVATRISEVVTATESAHVGSHSTAETPDVEESPAIEATDERVATPILRRSARTPRYVVPTKRNARKSNVGSSESSRGKAVTKCTSNRESARPHTV